MVGGFIIGLVTSVFPLLQISNFGLRLLVTAGITTVIWVVTMLLTPPESDETLDNFYRKVRPGGPGWVRQQQRTGLRPMQNLTLEGQRVLAALLILFGSMFAVGGFLLLQSLTGWLSLVAAVLGGFWLRKLNRQPAISVPRPGLDDEDVLR